MNDSIDRAARCDGAWHDRVLGSRLATVPFSRVTRRRLRVLAYHDVGGLEPFTAQMAWLAAECRPVTLADVAAAVAGHAPLPDRAVWVTFDDGHPEVIEQAQPLLGRYGIRATLFVCPSVVDGHEPFWWEVVDEASALGLGVHAGGSRWTGDRGVAELKRVPDAERRAAVEEARAGVTEVLGRPPRRRQVTSAELRAWLEAGHSVGNHSWDHPCLDRCTVAEQARQVAAADAWLGGLVGGGPKAFAYPNGNWAPQVEETLRDLGYDVGVVLDDRLARVDGPRLRMSRLSVSAHALLPRFRAIVSGAHTAAFHARHPAR